MAAKFGSWLLTDRGKKFCLNASAVASIGALSASYIPHTLLINTYKDVVHLYRNGISVSLPQKLKDRFQKALDMVGVDEDDQHLYKPFFSYGFDVMSAGGDFSKFGVIVGLPNCFAYDGIEDIDKSRIKAIDGNIKWDSEEGENLQNALILSENAQLYAMAREIKFRQKPKVMIDTALAMMGTITTYTLSYTLNNRLNLYNRPRSLRYSFYSLIVMFTFGTYIMLKDMSQIYFEQSVDKELVETNPVFIEGGREFYSKIIQRNIALRKLLGEKGESMFTVLGNENHMIRTKNLPLVQRKAFFDSKLPS